MKIFVWLISVEDTKFVQTTLIFSILTKYSSRLWQYLNFIVRYNFHSFSSFFLKIYALLIISSIFTHSNHFNFCLHAYLNQSFLLIQRSPKLCKSLLAIEGHRHIRWSNAQCLTFVPKRRGRGELEEDDERLADFRLIETSTRYSLDSTDVVLATERSVV